jgi:hypothetical protein
LTALAGECLDRAGVLGDGGQRPVPVGVGAQDVGQDAGVTGAGLLAGLAVTFPVARHRQRVNRVHGKPGCLQRNHEQVLVRLDRDRHGQDVPGWLTGREVGQQPDELGEPAHPSIDSPAGQQLAVVV